MWLNSYPPFWLFIVIIFLMAPLESIPLSNKILKLFIHVFF